MLWGSTCRAVTSFRPYDLVDRTRISVNRTRVYLPTYRRTTDRMSPDASTVLLRFRPTDLTDTETGAAH